MATGKKTNVLVWGILGLLVVGMFGFGTTGLTGRVRSLGTVGTLPIPVAAYSSELRQQIAAQSAQFNTTLSFAQAEALGIPQRAQQQVVTSRVMDNELVKLGISVGDATVRDQVRQNMAFTGPEGGFDRDRYAAVLRDNGLTEGEYESSIRDDTARAFLQDAVINGLPQPQVYAETLATFLGERRDFTWATLTPEDLADPLPTPTDDDLMAQYEATPDAYTSPETRAITYAWLTPEMIQDQVTVDEAELRQAYDERIDEFVQPERRLVERLVFESTEAAQAARDALDAGDKDFDTLVADRGLDLNDIDMGDVSERQLGGAGQAVFAAEPGEVVGPFDSDLGPALFRMNAVLAGRNISFEDAIPDLREEAAAARARRVISDQVDPITDLLAGGARLEDLADQTDMELGTMDWTAASEDGIAAYAEFRDVVSGLEPGSYPDLQQLEDGGLFAVRVDEIRAPALRPFDEVRDQVTADWQAAETKRRLLARAEELAGTITPETEFTEVGLADAIAERDLTRRSFINGTPPGFLETVFGMEPGAVETVETPEGAIIVRLDSVAPPPADDPAVTAETESVAQNGGEAMARDVFVYFSQAVQAQTDVTLDQRAINAVHANFR